MSPHRYVCHVRWSDVDAYGHVNNVKYFEYFQEARIAFVSGLVPGGRDGSDGFVVARLVVDYKRPILFRPEPFEILTWVTRVGTSSYGLLAEIRDGEQVLSVCTAAVVAFDLPGQRARPLNEAERTRLESAAAG